MRGSGAGLFDDIRHREILARLPVPHLPDEPSK